MKKIISALAFAILLISFPAAHAQSDIFPGGTKEDLEIWLLDRLVCPERYSAGDSTLFVINMKFDDQGNRLAIKYSTDPDNLILDQVEPLLREMKPLDLEVSSRGQVIKTFKVGYVFGGGKVEVAGFKIAEFNVPKVGSFSEWVINEIKTVAPRMKMDGSRVVVKFTVDTSGKVANIAVLESDNQRFSELVVDVLGNSPLWEPALFGGRPVDCVFTVPVTLRVPENSQSSSASGMKPRTFPSNSRF